MTPAELPGYFEQMADCYACQANQMKRLSELPADNDVDRRPVDLCREAIPHMQALSRILRTLSVVMQPEEDEDG